MKVKVLVLMLILIMPFLSVLSVKAPTTYLVDLSKWDSVFRIPAFTIATTSITSRNTLDLYQFNITLSRAIGINSISIAIETANLAFYYQPPLNIELIGKEYENWKINETHAFDDKGILRNYRPLNVVGSYAVYSTTKRDNEYKTGKLFHIYRPLIIDAKGKTSWATLNITKNVLTITVNQTFLNSASYPVTVDPTFGYTTKGGSSYSLSTDAYSSLFSLTENGTVTKLTIYVKNNDINNPHDIDVGIYNSAHVLLVHLIASVPASYDNWLDADIADTVLSTATYGLAFKQKSTSLVCYYDAGSANQLEAQEYMAVSANLPNPLVVGASYAYKFSIYATYTTGGQDLTFELSQTIHVTSSSSMFKEKGFSLTEITHLTSTLTQQKELSFPLSVTVKATSTLTMNKEILVVIHEWLYSLQETAHLTSNLYTDLEVAEKASLGLGFYIGVLALVIALMAYLRSRH